RPWQTHYRLPRTGISFSRIGFGNPQVLGHSWSLAPFLDLPLHKGPRTQLYGRMSYGLAWISRPYDPSLNPGNNAIGSHLNNVTSLHLLYERHIYRQMALRLGFSAIHHSNGRLLLPNLGLNTFLIRAGISFGASDLPERASPLPENPLTRKFAYALRVGLGGHARSSLDTRPYPVYVVSAMVSRRTGRWSTVFVGWEWSRDEAFSRTVQALYAGYELRFGRLAIMTQLQAQIWPLPSGLRFPGQKTGPLVYLFDPQRAPRWNVFGGIYLKSRQATADYTELALGVVF
ncbi:MAG: hypothetical protein EAZ89_04590, partial [Bacteroidetes bacterium]